jgi:DNA-directed RNA polymerase specialized sigma subunit
VSDKEIAERMEDAEPCVQYAVRQMLKLHPAKWDDAAQVGRLAIVQALRKGVTFQHKAGYALCAKNAIISEWRWARRWRRIDNSDRQEIFGGLPSREREPDQEVGGHELVQVVLASCRKHFSAKKCQMFECYIGGMNQRDIGRKFRHAKSHISRIINDMIQHAAKVVGNGQAEGHQAMVCSLPRRRGV